jgi:hypothetical protein
MFGELSRLHPFKTQPLYERSYLAVPRPRLPLGRHVFPGPSDHQPYALSGADSHGWSFRRDDVPRANWASRFATTSGESLSSLGRKDYSIQPQSTFFAKGKAQSLCRPLDTCAALQLPDPSGQ